MKSRMFKLTVAVMCVMLLCCSFAVSASAFSVFDIAEIFALDGSGEGTTEELSTLEITTEEGSVQEATTLEEPESTTEETTEENSEETTEEASEETSEETTETTTAEPPFNCTLEFVEAVGTTCTEDGKQAYYRCTDCGKCYEDAEGQVEITDIDNWGVIEANGHNNKKVTTKARRSADGKVELVCRDCGNRELVRTISKPASFKLSNTKYTYSGKVKTPKVTVKDENGCYYYRG